MEVSHVIFFLLKSSATKSEELNCHMPPNEMMMFEEKKGRRERGGRQPLAY